MKKSAVAHIIEKRCRHLQRQQEQLIAGFAMEANHNFRVEVKKLRALLRLLRHSHSPDLQLPKSLRLFYRSVGEVRSLQLQREMVQAVCQDLACPVPVGYLSLLYGKEKLARKHVKENARDVSISRLRHQLTRLLPPGLRKADVQDFVEQKRVQLVGYLNLTHLTDEALHNIRKLLKDLLYVWPWIESVLATSLFPEQFSKTNCMRLAEQLGKFQDCCTSLSFFSPAYLAGLPVEEQKKVAVIRQECIRKKEEQKEGIIEALLALRGELQVTTPARQQLTAAAAG